MQVSVEMPSSDESQSVESLSQIQEKSSDEVNSDNFQVQYEKVQRAKKALADFLEPTIIAAKNGKVSDKTAEEIVKETMEEIAREKLNDV